MLVACAFLCVTAARSWLADFVDPPWYGSGFRLLCARGICATRSSCICHFADCKRNFASERGAKVRSDKYPTVCDLTLSDQSHAVADKSPWMSFPLQAQTETNTAPGSAANEATPFNCNDFCHDPLEQNCLETWEGVLYLILLAT